MDMQKTVDIFLGYAVKDKGLCLEVVRLMEVVLVIVVLVLLLGTLIGISNWNISPIRGVPHVLRGSLPSQNNTRTAISWSMTSDTFLRYNMELEYLSLFQTIRL